MPTVVVTDSSRAARAVAGGPGRSYRKETRMPRDIPVGNGQLLVTFDHQYQMRDVFYPHVGQENHAGNGPCRFGIYADVPGQNRCQLAWTSSPGWNIRQRYLRDTLAT